MGRVLTERMVDDLSIAQRDVLLLHLDRLVPIVRGDANRFSTVRKLVALNLLRFEPPGAIRARATALTELGREALANLLGRYADALVRAGCLEVEVVPGERPLQMLRRLREAARTRAAEQSALRSRNL